MLTLGWMLSTGVGVVTAILVSANFFSGLTPTVMDGIFAFGFIAAAIGGLESPVGALVAGVAFGIVDAVRLRLRELERRHHHRPRHPGRLADGPPERGVHESSARRV